MTQPTASIRLHRFALALAGALAALAVALGLAACSTEPTLSQDEVVGIWNVTDSNGTAMADMNEKGAYVLYRFNDDGTFNMVSYLQDSSVQRDGTWEIDGETVLVDVPAVESEAASSDGPISSLSGDAIEDATITFEDGTLMAEGIGDGTVTAERIDEARYDEIVAHAASFAPRPIAVGEKVSTDNYTFAIDSLSYEDAILPSDTSGYYTYYDDQPDSTYLVARVSYTNNASDYAVIGYATSAQFVVGGNNYQGNIELDNGTLFGSSYRLEAKQSGAAIIWAAIPDSVKDSPDVTLTWSIPDDASLMQTFYQSSFDSTDYEVTL